MNDSTVSQNTSVESRDLVAESVDTEATSLAALGINPVLVFHSTGASLKVGLDGGVLDRVEALLGKIDLLHLWCAFRKDQSRRVVANLAMANNTRRRGSFELGRHRRAKVSGGR